MRICDWRIDVLTPVSRTASRVLLVFTLLAGATALAAQSQGPSQSEFRPVTAQDLAAQEHLPATPLVFWAYGFVWVSLAVYVFTLWRRLSRVERELADVNTRLEAKRR